jgi:hypothetical protein
MMALANWSRGEESTIAANTGLCRMTTKKANRPASMRPEKRVKYMAAKKATKWALDGPAVNLE